MNILHIITSPAAANSFSVNLGNAIVEKLRKANPDSSLVIRNLAAQPLPHYDSIHQNSIFTPIEDQSPEEVEVTNKSNEVIAELLAADAIVIGVPMYNFGIPSTLKSWIDYIARPGKTFNYTEAGPIGLVTGRTAYLAISTGDVYSTEELKAWDHTESYLRTVLNSFLGLNIQTVRVEGTVLPGIKEHALERAMQSVMEIV